MSTQVDTAQTNSQHFELASNEIKDNQELYKGTDVVGESTYAKEVQLEQFFAQLEGVQGKVEVNKKQIYRGFIRFNEETKGGKTKVVLESVNTKNWKFKNLIPLKWRTNLKSVQHNQSLRTTLSMAALKKFKGLSLGDLAKRTLLGNVTDASQLINEGAATVGKAGFHALVKDNKTKALEREEVDELRQRYFNITCTKDGLEKLAESTLLKVAAEANLDLLHLPADLAESYFRDYLNLDAGVFAGGDSVARAVTMHKTVRDALIAKLTHGTVTGPEGRSATTAEANLNKMRENLEGLKKAITRASANVKCRDYLNLGVNDMSGPQDVATRIRPKVANQIAELLTADLCNPLLGKDSGITLSRQEIERAVKLFCKVSPGDGKLCCLQRSLQKILEEIYNDPTVANLSGEEKNTQFYKICKTTDFIQKLNAEVVNFVKGYQSIKNFVGDAFSKEGQLKDIDAMALKMATARYGNGVSDEQVAIVKNQLEKTFSLLRDVKTETTNISEICQTEVDRFLAQVPEEMPDEMQDPGVALSDLGDDEKKREFFETYQQQLKDKIKTCEELELVDYGSADDWKPRLEQLGVEASSMPKSKEAYVSKVNLLKSDFNKALEDVQNELKPAEQPKVEQNAEPQAEQPKVEEPQAEQPKVEVPQAEQPKEEGNANVPKEKPDDKPVASGAFEAQRFLTEMLQDEYVQWYAERYYPTETEQSDENNRRLPMDYDFTEQQRNDIGEQLNLAEMGVKVVAQAKANAELRQVKPKSPEEFLIERHYLPDANAFGQQYMEKRTQFVSDCKNKLIDGAAKEISQMGFKYGIGLGEGASSVSYAEFKESVDSTYSSGERDKGHDKEIGQTGELTDEDFKDLPVNKNGIMHLYNIGMAAKNWYNVVSSVKKVADGGTSLSNVTNLPGVVTSLIAAVKQTNKAYRENRANELEYLQKVSKTYFDKKVFKNFYGVKDPNSVYNRLKDKLVTQAYLQKVKEDHEDYKKGLTELAGLNIDLYRSEVDELGDGKGLLFGSKLKGKVNSDQIARTLNNCVDQIAKEFNKDMSKGFLGLFKGSLQKTVDDYRETLKSVGPDHLYLLVGGDLPPKPSDPKDVEKWQRDWREQANEFASSGAADIFREMAVLNFQGELNRAFERAIDMFAAEMVQNDVYLAPDRDDQNAGKRITEDGLERLRGLIRTECAKVKVLQNDELVKVMTMNSPLVQSVLPPDTYKSKAGLEQNADRALDKFYESVLDTKGKSDYAELKSKRTSLDKNDYEAKRNFLLFAALEKTYPNVMQFYSTVQTFEMYLKAGKLDNLYNSLFIRHGKEGVKKFSEKFVEEAVKTLAEHCTTVVSTIKSIQKQSVAAYFAAAKVPKEDYESAKYARYRALVEQATVHALSADNNAFEAFMDISNVGGVNEDEKRTLFERLFGTKKFATKEVALKLLKSVSEDVKNKDGYSFQDLLQAKINEMKQIFKTEGLREKIGTKLTLPSDWTGMVEKFANAASQRKQPNAEKIKKALGDLAEFVTDVYRKQVLANVEKNKEYYWGEDAETVKVCDEELTGKVEAALKNLAQKILNVLDNKSSSGRFYPGSEHEQFDKLRNELEESCKQFVGFGVAPSAVMALLEGKDQINLNSITLNVAKDVKSFQEETYEEVRNLAHKESEEFLKSDLIQNWDNKIKEVYNALNLPNEVEIGDLTRTQNYFMNVYENFRVNGKKQFNSLDVGTAYKLRLTEFIENVKKSLNREVLVEKFITDNKLTNVNKELLLKELNNLIDTDKQGFAQYVKAVFDTQYANLAVENGAENNAKKIVADWNEKVGVQLKKVLDKASLKEALFEFAESNQLTRDVNSDMNSMQKITREQIEEVMENNPDFTIQKLKRMLVYQSIKAKMATYTDDVYFESFIKENFKNEHKDNVSSQEYLQDSFNPLSGLIGYTEQEQEHLIVDFKKYLNETLDSLHTEHVRNDGGVNEVTPKTELQECINLVNDQFAKYLRLRIAQRMAVNRLYVNIMTDPELRKKIDEIAPPAGKKDTDLQNLGSALKAFAYKELIEAISGWLKGFGFGCTDIKTLMKGESLFKFENKILTDKVLTDKNGSLYERINKFDFPNTKSYKNFALKKGKVNKDYTISFAEQQVSVVLNHYTAKIWTAVIAKKETSKEKKEILNQIAGISPSKASKVDNDVELKKYVDSGNGFDRVRLVFNTFTGNEQTNVKK